MARMQMPTRHATSVPMHFMCIPTPVTWPGCMMQALARQLPLAPDVHLDEIAAQSEGLTGADLSALLSEAQLLAVHQALEAPSAAGPVVPPPPPPPAAAAAQTAAPAVAAAGAAAGSPAPAIAVDSTGDGDASLGVNTAGQGTEASGKAAGSSDPGIPGAPTISAAHLQRALDNARPSLPAAELRRLQAVYERFLQSRGNGSGCGAAGGGTADGGAGSSNGGGSGSSSKRATLA